MQRSLKLIKYIKPGKNKLQYFFELYTELRSKLTLIYARPDQSISKVLQTKKTTTMAKIFLLMLN